MDVETRTSILIDAFNELKKKWSDVKDLEEDFPESRMKDLFEMKEKYQLNDMEFLFIVGIAIGFYHGQKVAYEEISKKIAVINEFVSSFLRKKV